MVHTLHISADLNQMEQGVAMEDIELDHKKASVAPVYFD